jgi:WD40 repeat protein
MLPPARRSTVAGMPLTGIRARRRSLLLLGAAGAAGALTACAGDADETAVPDAERLGQYPPLPGGAIGGLAWSPKGDLLAATGTGKLVLYPADTATGGGGQPISREAHGGKNVAAVTWSPDGTRIVTIGHDKTLQFWTAAGEPTHTVPLDYVHVRASVRWSPAGNRLLVYNGLRLFVVDVSGATPGPLVRGAAFHIAGDVTWASDGRSVYVVAALAIVRLQDDAQQRLTELRDPDTHEWRTLGAVTDGRVAVAIRRDKPAAKDELDRVRSYSDGLTKPGPEFEIPTACDTATVIRFSSDGHRIAVRFWDGPICVWEVTGTKGRLVGVYREHGERVEGRDNLAWQPGTDRVASLGADGTIHLWRPRA